MSRRGECKQLEVLRLINLGGKAALQATFPLTPLQPLRGRQPLQGLAWGRLRFVNVCNTK